MGGFHMLDIIVVAAIALALFGPKALQSMARGAGKGVAQAKDMKDKLMSDLPVEDITNITDHIPQVPLNARQAVGMLLASDAGKEKEPKTEPKKAEEEHRIKANEL
jgi:Sec-independent protein translocase protein TatA